MASEYSIEQSFKRWCKAEGLWCIKLKLNPGRGWPDRAVLLPNNRMCWIEFKSNKGVVSVQQEFIIEKMRANGHLVFVCNSLESAQDAVAQVSSGDERLHPKPIRKEAGIGSVA